MGNIPKIIHACWFGGSEYTNMVKKCMQSWKKYLPEYKIIIWNESNFDININQYVKDAYKNKQWAFVSDFVRIHCLYEYGGIYLDTDVEIKKNMDIFLDKKLFIGFESKREIATCLIGSEPKHAFIGKVIYEYSKKKFNEKKEPPNTSLFTSLLISEGLKVTGEYQYLNSEITIYPQEYFSPLEYDSNFRKFTEKTYAIHHFSGSWLSFPQKVEMRVMKLLQVGIIKRILGK